MFKSLKQKLQGWVSKIKTSQESEKKEKIKKQEAKVQKEKSKPEKSTKTSRVPKKRKPAKPEQELIIQDIEEPERKGGFFAKFKTKLTEKKFEQMFEELELILLQNNVAVKAVESIKQELHKKLVGKNLSDTNLSNSLKQAISNILINPPNLIQKIKASLKEKAPFVICFIGINGSGKTTSMAKLAHLLKKQKLSVCLAAADTFRAASIEQLQKHANNLKVPLIKKHYGADPASVGFDAVQYAKKHRMDIVLIDTAGRMQNQDSLMKEIEKIVRVNKPDLKIFVGESITGNDATEQAQKFNQAVSIDGIILAKADIDEKGGTAISVSEVTQKPILFLGTGQSYNDLEVFDKNKVIKNLGL